MNRRTFLTRAASFLAAPAIVRAASLMPVQAPRLDVIPLTGFIDPAVFEELFFPKTATEVWLDMQAGFAQVEEQTRRQEANYA